LSSGEVRNVRGWALNAYAGLLLDNDSIVKAEELLLDSSIHKWSEMESWIQDYHTINLGSVYAYKGNYIEADKLYREVLQGTIDGQLKIQAVQGLAKNLRFQGKLNQSLVKWYEALTLSEEIQDSTEIVESYLGKGVVRFMKNELEKSETDILLFYGFHLRRNNEKLVAYGLSRIGMLEYQKGNYEESIESNLEGYAIRRRLNDLKGQGESLKNLALGYMGLKNWSQALQYLEEAVQVKTQANDLTQMTVILNNIGHCYSRLGKNQEALNFFHNALDKGRENGQMGDVVNSYNNIIKIKSTLSDYQAALEYQAELLQLKDSLSAAERIETMHELEVKYETEKKEGEIILLQQDKTIITNRWLTLALGLFLAIIITVLIIDNQKRKHQQEKELLLKEDELQKAELKNMSDMLEFNQNKLSLYTENLLKKNELVGQLESRLKSILDFSSPKTESDKKLVQDFSAVRILTDEDWTEFKTLFNRVHQGLLDRLLSSYSGLTLGEQRLFLLMKLDLTTKEIANILGVSPESIKKGRYRLKKKLQMGESTTLQDFVNSF
jgi:tetratricopeptide (TPR) repeat protein